ncbi:MAG: 1-phosphofructokinase [Lachnospiraceae bacterium]|nr:1-phosphofructokinase [Lachnospiraceae bacterium]
MIYTVTLNPAIDYCMYPEGPLLPGETNRSRREEAFVGGKGNNVSRVLRGLGCESVAMGFCAGFTGDEILRGLEEAGIRTDYVRLSSGCSRINVKLKSPGKGDTGVTVLETEINGSGPEVPEEAQESFLAKIAGLREGDTLVLSGSVPGSLPADFYERILKSLPCDGIRTVVDAAGDLLRSCLPYGPFLVKPNLAELEQITGRSLVSLEEITAAADALAQQGAQHVLVSLGAAGAILCSGGECIRREAPKGTLVNSVGSGDSMVAGFLAAISQGRKLQEALKFAVAAGSATAFTSDLATGKQIRELYQSM